LTIGLLRTQRLRMQNLLVFFKNPRDIKLLKKLPPVHVAPSVIVIYIRIHHWTLHWDRSFCSSHDTNLTPISKLSLRAILQMFLPKLALFHLQMHTSCSVHVIVFDMWPYYYLMPSTNYRAPFCRVLFIRLFLSLSLRPNIISSLCSPTASMYNVGAIEMKVYK